jgi:TM2 domain-containing membrane protein YozV
MRSVIIAILLSAFVWPGAGQLYNRDFRKGFVLTALTALLWLSFFIGAQIEFLKRLPADTSAWDFSTLRAALHDILQTDSQYISAFTFLITAVTLYSVIDAYWTARDRRKRGPTVPPTEGDASA